MAIFRNRLPSRRDAILVLGTCAFAVFLRSISVGLGKVSTWMLRMSVWDLIGVIAYLQALALLDTLFLFGCLLLVGAILPARWFRDRFVPAGSILAYLTTLWVVITRDFALIALFGLGIKPWFYWLVMGVAYVGLVAALYSLIQRRKSVQTLICLIAERLTVLSWLYIGVGLVSVVIVIIRNIT